jgi:hypothetical protein
VILFCVGVAGAVAEPETKSGVKRVDGGRAIGSNFSAGIDSEVGTR